MFTKIKFSNHLQKHIMSSAIATFSNLTVCDVGAAKVRMAGDISSAFGLFATNNDELDATYIQIKKDLIKDPEAVKQSWLRLKSALSKGIEEIKQKGSSVIPEIPFSEIDTISDDKREEILKRGCVIVKLTIPADRAKSLKDDVVEYIARNPHTKGFPSEKKVVYELYWSKSQVKARSNENIQKTQLFANKLWHSDKTARLSLDHNLMYADRMRIRDPGDNMFSLGPHADSGSLERWDDKEYSKCYQSIFDGDWENYDPYDATHRVNVDMTKYDSSGTSNVFRTFQGWLALSEIAPMGGTILFAPLIKEVTAYWILKPFFDESDNFKFDSDFPGAHPGTSQEFSPATHPELQLDSLMVSIPKVQPGDMVYWHCDCIHAVDPVHKGLMDSSVFYIPALPLCDINLKYSWLQRESFMVGLAPPDFPGFPLGEAETRHVGRASPEDVAKEGGEAALQAFALRPLSAVSDAPGEAAIIADANKLLFV